MIDLDRITGARTPLTLAGLPTGFLPVVLADLTRAATGRLVFVAPDASLMDALADTTRFFAPEIDIIRIPAWDCLPYDRASPSLRSAAERLARAACAAKQSQGSKPRPDHHCGGNAKGAHAFSHSPDGCKLAPGERIAIERLVSLLQANGYVRTDTVHDAGEYAVRGGIVDLFPSGESGPLRLDFFGDEIETLRRFDAATQRTVGGGERIHATSRVEALLDEDSIKRFRGRYRETFGASATGDPLYQAVSEGRRLAGMEHWLPLFEDKLCRLPIIWAKTRFG